MKFSSEKKTAASKLRKNNLRKKGGDDLNGKFNAVKTPNNPETGSEPPLPKKNLIDMIKIYEFIVYNYLKFLSFFYLFLINR